MTTAKRTILAAILTAVPGVIASAPPAPIGAMMVTGGGKGGCARARPRRREAEPMPGGRRPRPAM
jgi:hypothetical protein